MSKLRLHTVKCLTCCSFWASESSNSLCISSLVSCVANLDLEVYCWIRNEAILDFQLLAHCCVRAAAFCHAYVMPFSWLIGDLLEESQTEATKLRKKVEELVRDNEALKSSTTSFASSLCMGASFQTDTQGTVISLLWWSEVSERLDTRETSS